MAIGKERTSRLDAVELSYSLDITEAEELLSYVSHLGEFPLKSTNTRKMGALYIYSLPNDMEKILAKIAKGNIGELKNFGPFFINVKNLAISNGMEIDAKLFIHRVPGELYVASVDMEISAPEDDD